MLAGQKHAESITPAFYRYLQAQEAEKQVEYGKSVEFTLGIHREISRR